MDEVVLQAAGLGRRFGEGREAVTALQDLDLEVRRGEVLGLLGHNGAGKTTSVRLFNGVLEPTRGSARVLGLDPSRDGPGLRARTGVLTETPALDERLKARETLVLYGRIFGLGARRARARADALLAEFGLEGRADEPAARLSKGLKQRLALARTLAHEPELLFLDEPTSGLDPVAAREVHELIGRLTGDEGRTVVLCTHNLVEAQRLCTRVAVLRRGRLVALGTPEALAQRIEGVGAARLTVPAEARLDARRVLASALSDHSGVRVSEAEPHDALLVEGGGRASVAAAVAALVAAGIPVYAAVPHETTLEDAYFALAGEELA